MSREAEHAILRNVRKHIRLTSKEKSNFLKSLSIRELKKKTTLLEQGERCNEIHYIHKGAIRAFFRDRQGNENVIMFGIDDWWITDMFSFTNEKPAMLTLESIESSTILSLRKKSFDKLLADSPAFERFFRIIFQNSYIREQLRTVQNLSMNASQRYEYFLQKYPAQARRIPQKYIASYLGITPEFLSAIRRKKE